MRRHIDRSLVVRSRAKRRQASKLAEIRQALVAAGFDTVDRQAIALGIKRPTAWALLNRDKRTGPSAKIIKRILSSPNLPTAVRRRVEEYIEQKIEGVYGHNEARRRWFREQFQSRTRTKTRPEPGPLDGEFLETDHAGDMASAMTNFGMASKRRQIMTIKRELEAASRAMCLARGLDPDQTLANSTGKVWQGGMFDLARVALDAAEQVRRQHGDW